jgi:hypothetical protein
MPSWAAIQYMLFISTWPSCVCGTLTKLMANIFTARLFHAQGPEPSRQQLNQTTWRKKLPGKKKGCFPLTIEAEGIRLAVPNLPHK